MAGSGRTGTKGVPRAAREQQILDAAQREFARVGYSAAAVPDIAARAGISKPLVYSYFGSKEQLYVACAGAAGALIAGEVDRTAGLGAVGVERGLLTVAGLIDVLDSRPHLWCVLFDRTVPAGSEAAATVTGYTARLHERAIEGVAEMLRLAGESDAGDLDVLTRVWVGMLDTVMRWWAEHPDEPGSVVLGRVERIAALLLRGA